MAIPQLAKIVLYDCSTINATGDFFMSIKDEAQRLHNATKRIHDLKQQRAELLEALKEILCEYEAYNCYACEELIAQAHSAINKAEAAE